LRFMCFLRFCMFFIFVITFEPKKIQIRLAPQNDRLSLSFVKDIYVVGEKMTRSCHKTGHLAFTNFVKHPLLLLGNY
jgi:hypothetical protein